MELIRLENICKTYHLGEVDVPVLNGISLTINQGELVALIGASGSGKSTLMNILGCLDRPTSGQYWLDGREVGQLAPNERALVRSEKLGFVFQSFNLLSRTTATANVAMPLDYAVKPVSAAAAADRASELLVRVGLSHRLDHMPSQMSGGQQQRVAIARSLVNAPSLLLADEPTGNLDSHTTVEILQMFRQLNATGITVMLVTHDPDVAKTADRVIHIVDGLIDSDTSPNGDDPHFYSSHGNGNGNGSGKGSANGHGNGNGNGHGHLPIERHTIPSPAKELAAVGTAAIPAATHAPTATIEAPAAHLDTKTAIAADVDQDDPLEAKVLRRRRMPSLVPPTVRTAVNALRRNKMRSALTTLGIVIGVGAVIAMVEISQGSKTALMRTMSTMGANNLSIRSGAATSGGISWGSGSEKTLTPIDAEEIAKQCDAVAAVAPIVQIRGQVVRGNRNWTPMDIYGTTPDYLTVRDWNSLDSGDMFTDQDVRGSIKSCVIGKTIERELFPGESPIGKDIRVQNVALRVVGVLSPKGANMMGMDQDDLILAPWTTIKFRVSGTNTGGASGANAAAEGTTGATTVSSADPNALSNTYPGAVALYPTQSSAEQLNNPQRIMFTNVDQILTKAVSAEAIPDAIDQITELLHERHHIRAGNPDDFTIRDMSEILKMLGSTSQMMSMLLLIVAMISLVVGGIGIMNIMLVSVTERTKEIGVRMAVGARSHQILRQFLIEAIVLCLLGGAAGILFGRSSAMLVWYFLRWPITASLPAIIGAFAVSATIGIAFGFYPAWKASRLDPIDALRYE
jgi:ABC-type lipoprotein export system ATPase subunit/ABC-type antimicrobial peptide transport system permease subunit